MKLKPVIVIPFSSQSFIDYLTLFLERVLIFPRLGEHFNGHSTTVIFGDFNVDQLSHKDAKTLRFICRRTR